MHAKKYAIAIMQYLWAAPTTMVGMPLLLATLVTGGKAYWHSGVFAMQCVAATAREKCVSG